MQILTSILILDAVLNLMHEKPFHFQMFDCSGLGKNKIIFGIDSNSSVYSDNKGPADGLDDTAITAEGEFFVNFGEQQEKFAREENCPPVRVRVWFRISVRIRAGGGAFS